MHNFIGPFFFFASSWVIKISFCSWRCNLNNTTFVVGRRCTSVQITGWSRVLLENPVNPFLLIGICCRRVPVYQANSTLKAPIQIIFANAYGQKARHLHMHMDMKRFCICMWTKSASKHAYRQKALLHMRMGKKRFCTCVSTKSASTHAHAQKALLYMRKNIRRVVFQNEFTIFACSYWNYIIYVLEECEHSKLSMENKNCKTCASSPLGTLLRVLIFDSYLVNSPLLSPVISQPRRPEQS